MIQAGKEEKKMKVLVATSEGQGMRENDFCFTEEGEFVSLPFECDGEQVDGPCGCMRSFAGMHSSKGTTTAKVVEKGITSAQFVALTVRSRMAGGWIKSGDPVGWVVEEAEEMLRLASTFPVGVVVEKRGDGIQERRRGR